jgi:hypothetical protein
VSEWGRKQYQGWAQEWRLSRNVPLLAMLAFVGLFWLQSQYLWTSLQRYYFWTYVETWALPLKPAKDYNAIYAGTSAMGDGNPKKWLYASDKDVELQGEQADGTSLATVLPGASARGWTKWWEASANAGDAQITGSDFRGVFLRPVIYRGWTQWDFVKYPAYGALALTVVLFWFTVPRDRKHNEEMKRGKRLRGPELVSTAEFNKRLGKRGWLMRYPPDGLGFINEERSRSDKFFRDQWSRWVRIPKKQEAKHFLLIGDTGTGKTVTIMQMLMQVRERGERAIIYDPKGKLFEQFGDLNRGDVLLNPLDKRGPFWDMAAEITHPAEALTLAASLFPDTDPKDPFFVPATRKLFAYLLNLKPTPEELIYWLCNEQEIDRRVKGTEHAAKINPQGGSQRSGVLGSLSMIGDALRLLPREAESKQRWSAAQWAEKGTGWIFITSEEAMEESLRPLISLWIELLVLRAMREGLSSALRTWFVLDELANLQRLPKLEKAVTQGRESNCVMVLGFQGRAQMNALYGHDIAEAILSSPATRIYLKTSEPNAGEWISKAIGEIEVERYRESRTQGQYPQQRNSASYQQELAMEPLVMASEINGLDDLHGYLKHGNYVVRLHVPHLKLPARNEVFIKREFASPTANVPEGDSEPVAPPAQPSDPAPLAAQQHFFE